MTSRARKSPNAFRTISEVADLMGVPQHVLRFWESKFSQIAPMKRGGGRRYYRPEDVEIIDAIRRLLHEDGYTIKGAQKYLKEHGVKTVLEASHNADTAGKPNSSSQNTYEEQIVTLTQQSNAITSDDAEIISSLKDIRARLDTIRLSLK